jgi:DNA polymerase I-like protein with 3'-5' exonuclease and polymerase domains
MLDFITKAQYEELKAARANRYHPLLKSTLEILKIYDKEMPEVDELLRKASKLAEDRGYIKTILGRRMRFPHGYRLHKALNGRIQGSEADIVKTKAVELHEARKYTGLRLQFQVHDEFDGCVPDEEAAKKVSEILNAQSFNLTVPILWGMKTGVTWGDCSRDEIEKMKKEAHR